MSEWYYIGHYGQLGPLSRDQIEELIAGGVITRETFVWKTGMTDWVQADSVPDLAPSFVNAPGFAAPPPPPRVGSSAGSVATESPTQLFATSAGATAGYPRYGTLQGPYGAFPAVESDRSRVAAGILQLFLPGVGRIYLGYMAIGVLQLLFSIITCGVGVLWSFIDGILILAGTPRLDGYGRLLKG